MIELKWKKLHSRAQIPGPPATEGSACFDLRAALDEDLLLEPGKIVAISTGLAVEIPLGYELQVRARSGLALKHGLTLVNGIGTVDADYRGEIKIISTILGRDSFVIKNGERVAQALVSPVLKVSHVEASELSSTDRGAGGFGSSGKL